MSTTLNEYLIELRKLADTNAALAQRNVIYDRVLFVVSVLLNAVFVIAATFADKYNAEAFVNAVVVLNSLDIAVHSIQMYMKFDALAALHRKLSDDCFNLEQDIIIDLAGPDPATHGDVAAFVARYKGIMGEMP